MLWELFQTHQIARSNWQAQDANLAAQEARRSTESLQGQVQNLQQQCERLTLAAMAIAELLRDRLGVTQAEIENKILEIDQRDGQEDGRFRPAPGSCPKCQHLNGVSRTQCLYCGNSLGSGSILFPMESP